MSRHRFKVDGIEYVHPYIDEVSNRNYVRPFMELVDDQHDKLVKANGGAFCVICAYTAPSSGYFSNGTTWKKVMA